MRHETCDSTLAKTKELFTLNKLQKAHKIWIINNYRACFSLLQGFIASDHRTNQNTDVFSNINPGPYIHVKRRYSQLLYQQSLILIRTGSSAPSTGFDLLTSIQFILIFDKEITSKVQSPDIADFGYLCQKHMRAGYHFPALMFELNKMIQMFF